MSKAKSKATTRRTRRGTYLRATGRIVYQGFIVVSRDGFVNYRTFASSPDVAMHRYLDSHPGLRWEDLETQPRIFPATLVLDPKAKPERGVTTPWQVAEGYRKSRLKSRKDR